MTASPNPDDGERRARPGVPAEESLLQGGVKGVVLVTLATAALAAAGALIALVVAWLY